MKRTTCKSGVKGWKGRLRNVYSRFDIFQVACDTYGISSRLGYTSPKRAWKANPTIEGSVCPSDLRRCKR